MQMKSAQVSYSMRGIKQVVDLHHSFFTYGRITIIHV